LTYVALGHIHRAQRVRRETIRYAGAPLFLALEEASYKHQVVAIEIASPGTAGARSTPGGSAESIASPGTAGARSTAGGSAESIASPGTAGARSTAGGSAESIASPGTA